MHTLIDFTTHVKGVEYIISVLAITGYIFYSQVLKPRPFKVLKEAAREDLEHMRNAGTRSTLRSVGRLAAAPFIGLAYVLSLPFIFTFAFLAQVAELAAEGLDKLLAMAGSTATFGWRPVEAYLGGKKDRKKGKAKAEAKADADAPEAKKE